MIVHQLAAEKRGCRGHTEGGVSIGFFRYLHTLATSRGMIDTWNLFHFFKICPFCRSLRNSSCHSCWKQNCLWMQSMNIFIDKRLEDMSKLIWKSPVKQLEPTIPVWLNNIDSLVQVAWLFFAKHYNLLTQYYAVSSVASSCSTKYLCLEEIVGPVGGWMLRKKGKQFHLLIHNDNNNLFCFSEGI